MQLLFTTISTTTIISNTTSIRVTLAVVESRTEISFYGCQWYRMKSVWEVKYLLYSETAQQYLIAARLRSRCGEKKGWAGTPLVLVLSQHSQCLHVSGAKNCAGGHKTSTCTLDTYFRGETSFFQPLECSWRCSTCLVLAYDNINLVWDIQNSEA